MKSTQRNETLRSSARLYTFVAVGLAVLASLLGVIALTQSYDTNIGYYNTSSPLPTVLTVLCTASVVFFAVFATLRFRACPSAYAKKTPLAVQITAAATAAVALLLAITNLRAGSSLFVLLMGLATCLYFLLIATKKMTPALSLAFGFCTMLRCIVEITSSYADLLIPMNSPEKIWLHLAAIAGIFFLLLEIRFLVGTPYTAIFFFAAASATLLCATASLTLLAGSLTALFYGAPTKSDILFFVLLFCLAVYAGTRLVTLAYNPNPIETIETLETIEANETTEENKDIEEPEED